jgi:hypothetical protein
MIPDQPRQKSLGDSLSMWTKLSMVAHLSFQQQQKA